MNTITLPRAVVEQALEALERLQNAIYNTELFVANAAADSAEKPMGTLRAALAEPVPHGCHVDLDDDMEPDGCVLDEGSPHTCVYADRLLREGKNKTACAYWKPIEVKK